jgi:hypothetical protein
MILHFITTGFGSHSESKKDKELRNQVTNPENNL